MSLEFAAYIVVACGAYLAFACKDRKVVYAWSALYVAYLLIARASEPAIDMPSYYEIAARWPPETSVYYLREALFWFTTAFLNRVIGNAMFTFFILDVLSMIIVFRSARIIDGERQNIFFFIPIVLSSYIFLLGQQNGFRQYMAFVVFLWVFAKRFRRSPSAIWLFLLTAWIHNAVFALVGCLIDAGRSREKYPVGPYITISSVILLYLFWPLLGKSSGAAGLDTSGLYIVVLASILSLATYAANGRMTVIRSPSLLNFVTFLPSILFLSALNFERLAGMFLILVLLELYQYRAEVPLDRLVVGSFAYAVLVLPVVFFQSTMLFLT